MANRATQGGSASQRLAVTFASWKLTLLPVHRPSNQSVTIAYVQNYCLNRCHCQNQQRAHQFDFHGMVLFFVEFGFQGVLAVTCFWL
jgi:hypothetical protein